MESIRIMRRLNKELKNLYPDFDGRVFAERLYEVGVTEITEDICAKINYLMTICQNFELDYCGSDIIVNLSLDDLKARYVRFKTFCPESECTMSSLVLSETKFDQYYDFFKSFGMKTDQINKAMGSVVDNGIIMKNIEEAKAAVAELERFHISEDVRNEFVSENADVLFDDYSRKISEYVSALIEEDGEIEGFKKLVKYPGILRVGL